MPLGRTRRQNQSARSNQNANGNQLSDAQRQQVEEQYGPLLDAVDERVERGVTPLREQNAELRSRMEELSRPIHDAQQMLSGPASVAARTA